MFKTNGYCDRWNLRWIRCSLGDAGIVADLGCLFRISSYLGDPGPNNNKRVGKINKLVVLPFFVKINFTKFINIKLFEQVQKEVRSN
jgi:hypothetical protein